jgi:two-component system response regulator DesR
VIRLLLADDTQSTSQLGTLLQREEDISVVAHIDFKGDVVALARQVWPHVLLINTDYMVSQVLPLISELKATNPTCSVLILSDPSKHGMLPPRTQARDVSFLIKDIPVPMLARAIRRVAAGERLVHPRLEIAAIRTNKAFTTRELEILGRVSEGDSVAEIAQRLCLSFGTIRNYVSSIIMKTGARNRIDAIRIARNDGWLR